ncbi:hypothetical protein GCM10010429_54620 [Micromonospora olivasterospora]
MSGNATFTIVRSSSNMNVPRQTAVSVHHFGSTPGRDGPRAPELAAPIRLGSVIGGMVPAVCAGLSGFWRIAGMGTVRGPPVRRSCRMPVAVSLRGGGQGRPGGTLKI